MTGSPVCGIRRPPAPARLSSTTGPVGVRVTPFTSSARILGREPAITDSESLDEDELDEEGEADRAAGFPRASTGGPESSDDEGRATDPPDESPAAISAFGVPSPLLTAARRMRGRSLSSALDEFEELEVPGDDAVESSPLLDDARRSFGRSESSLELLPVEELLVELFPELPEDEPSIDFDASVRSSGVPALNSDTFSAW